MSAAILAIAIFGAWEIDWLMSGAIGIPGAAGRRFHQIGNLLNRILDGEMP